MAITNTQPLIWDGRLLGAPNNIYYDLINVEATAPSYADRKRPSGFFLKKRKGYRRDNVFNQVVGNGWTVTDRITIDDNGALYNFFYVIDDDTTRFKIICQPVGTCGCYFEIWDDFRNEDGYDKFVVLDYVKGVPVNVVTSGSQLTVGTIENYVNSDFSGGTPPDYRAYPNATQNINWSSSSTPDATKAQVGDYVLVYDTSNDTGSAVPGQVRQIIGYDSSGDFLRVSSGWLGMQSQQESADDATFSVFKDWGKVFMFDTVNGMKMWHTSGLVEINECDYTVDPFFTDIYSPVKGGVSLISAQAHDNRFFGQFSTGFSFYGQSGYNKFYFSADQAVEFGDDVHTLVSYRDFIIGFGDSIINAALLQGNNAQVFELRDDIGIRSTNAHDIYDNSLYMIASDKRLYAVSVFVDGDGFQLKLDDLSQFIRGDLELLQEGDEVSVQADGRYLRIFINSKNDPDDELNNNTKIIIFDRDYQLWYKHIVCCGRIETGSGTDYYGDGVYYYCGFRDCYTGEGPECTTCGDYFDASIKALIGENEDNGTNLNTFQKKDLTWLKIMFGRGIYNDGSTNINLTYNRDGYRFTHSISNFNGKQWFDDHNSIYQGISVSEPACLDNVLPDNTTIKSDAVSNTYSLQTLQTSPVNSCICEDEERIFNNHCIEVQDDGHYLQSYYNVFVQFDSVQETELIEVEIECKDGDRINFGGMMAEVIPYAYDHTNGDGTDVVANEC